MKYKVSLNIDRPVDDVTRLFSDPEHIKKWQPELVSMTLLEGEAGEAGSKSRLKFKLNGREMEMTETIVFNNLPKEFTSTYETKGVYNIQTNHFEKVGEKKTKWTTISEFRFSGFMKWIGWLMPHSFRRQTLKYMRRLKALAENNTDPDHPAKQKS